MPSSPSICPSGPVLYTRNQKSRYEAFLWVGVTFFRVSKTRQKRDCLVRKRNGEKSGSIKVACCRQTRFNAYTSSQEPMNLSIVFVVAIIFVSFSPTDVLGWWGRRRWRRRNAKTSVYPISNPFFLENSGSSCTKDKYTWTVGTRPLAFSESRRRRDTDASNDAADVDASTQPAQKIDRSDFAA